MKRRHALLAGSSCIGTLLSGCLGGTSESSTGTPSQTPSSTESDTQTRTVAETPVYDCDEVNRPPEPASDDDPPGEDERYTYPQRPESLTDESTLLSYVKEYERAYRLNDLYTEYGDNLDHGIIFIYETWTYEAPEGAAIARLKCPYSHGYTRGDRQVEADSPTIYASYYIDDAVVLRASTSGYQEDESKLVPDPIEWGLPMECF